MVVHPEQRLGSATRRDSAGAWHAVSDQGIVLAYQCGGWPRPCGWVETKRKLPPLAYQVVAFISVIADRQRRGGLRRRLRVRRKCSFAYIMNQRFRTGRRKRPGRQLISGKSNRRCQAAPPTLPPPGRQPGPDTDQKAWSIASLPFGIRTRRGACGPEFGPGGRVGGLRGVAVRKSFAYSLKSRTGQVAGGVDGVHHQRRRGPVALAIQAMDLSSRNQTKAWRTQAASAS